MKEFTSKIYFEEYLRNIRKLSESSIKHYFESINYISKLLKRYNYTQENIYEIYDLNELTMIKEFLMNNPEFIAVDARGKRMYSAGFNNYIRFAEGTFLDKEKTKLVYLDKPLPIKDTRTIISEANKRSYIFKVQTLKNANYMCEVNNAHETFLSKNNDKPYMEAHHIIPLKNQENFEFSIDNYPNLICLCPICHRKLHYGRDDDRTIVLENIYHQRKDRLASTGVFLSRNEFINFAIR